MKKLYLMALLFAGSFSACEKSEISSGFETAININMFEVLDAGNGRNFQLRLSTAKIYPCVNYYIKHSVVKEGKEISIKVEEIVAPGICLTALGPAGASIDLGVLEHGTYALTVEIGQVVNRGTLVVDEPKYTLHFDRPVDLRIPTDELYRIPGNAVWGLVGYPAVEMEKFADQFIVELEELGGSRLHLPQGEYGYFTTDAQGDMIVGENHGYWYAKALLYGYEFPAAELHDLVKRYGAGYPDLSINLYDAKGNAFRSWGN